MTVSYPNNIRNYCIFSPNVHKRIENGENELPMLRKSLNNPKSQDEVVEDLYILNCLIDNGLDPDKAAKLYPELSKYNSSDSPDIQTFLAGIYRKIKIPDAFGPLIAMLIKNSVNSTKNPNIQAGTFDPNEEIGGAILSYLA